MGNVIDLFEWSFKRDNELNEEKFLGKKFFKEITPFYGENDVVKLQASKILGGYCLTFFCPEIGCLWSVGEDERKVFKNLDEVTRYIADNCTEELQRYYLVMRF